MISESDLDPLRKLPPVTIVIPTYGAAEKLSVCLESLSQFAPLNCRIYVIDDATPDESIQNVCQDIKDRLPQLHYVRNQVNMGFVQTCNKGVAAFREPACDVLLLNSDTEVTAGFLEEMYAVLHLHEKHGVVTPRSNNATIFSVPWAGSLPPGPSYTIWERISNQLPRYHIMPTAVGFCMLIKGIVLDRFPLFDPIYSPGYNEENDFVCHINRRGYSAVAANWAYVFHHEGASFGTQRASLEQRNRTLLLERYPEYERKVSDYVNFQVDPVEVFSILEAPHRPRLLFDLFHLPAMHSGTSDFGLNLLREVRFLIDDEVELYVGMDQSLPFFASELRGYRIYEDRPKAPISFDLVYKPCQIFTWHEFRRMNRLAPRVSYTMQDIIAVRCDYLSAAYRRFVFRKSAELSDMVFTISNFSRSDFEAFYGARSSMKTIHLGTNMGLMTGAPSMGQHVLIMGNSFAHKGVVEAIRSIQDDWPIVVLGGADNPVPKRTNVRWLASGKLSRQAMRELFVNAKILIYPSHYEGFGLPVLDALALGKPTIVLDSDVNRELAEIGGDKNLHFIRSLEELHSTVQQVLLELPGQPATPRYWRDVAQEYVTQFRKLLNVEIDIARLRARWEFLRILEASG